MHPCIATLHLCLVRSVQLPIELRAIISQNYFLFLLDYSGDCHRININCTSYLILQLRVNAKGKEYLFVYSVRRMYLVDSGIGCKGLCTNKEGFYLQSCSCAKELVIPTEKYVIPFEKYNIVSVKQALVWYQQQILSMIN